MPGVVRNGANRAAADEEDVTTGMTVGGLDFGLVTVGGVGVGDDEDEADCDDGEDELGDVSDSTFDSSSSLWSLSIFT